MKAEPDSVDGPNRIIDKIGRGIVHLTDSPARSYGASSLAIVDLRLTDQYEPF